MALKDIFIPELGLEIEGDVMDITTLSMVDKFDRFELSILINESLDELNNIKYKLLYKKGKINSLIIFSSNKVIEYSNIYINFNSIRTYNNYNNYNNHKYVLDITLTADYFRMFDNNLYNRKIKIDKILNNIK